MMETSNVEFLEIPHRFGFAAETIREARFDLLYYWEVGSDVLNYFLPFLRLAPVQCTSGGLPVTSGIPTMDYFLSSELAEPEFADEHYSETLIRATSQLSYQRRMPRPQVAKTRADFGFAESQHLYVCAQKIQKFHPDFDRLMAEILRRDQFGLVVIPEDPHGYASRKLRSRMMSALPDVIDRVAFLPRLSLDDYFSLLDVADVLLDPLHYGGGLTAYDGFSLNKPIVTLPGEFVRGRYTYACYRRMGLTSCVAKTGKQYVEIALQLGTDPAVRAEAEAQLEEATSVLFEDQQAIRDYEEIFSELIETARCKS
jgi:predicted O-linked N-acetylglucosamine transferase (SPINDLY family)